LGVSEEKMSEGYRATRNYHLTPGEIFRWGRSNWRSKGAKGIESTQAETLCQGQSENQGRERGKTTPTKHGKEIDSANSGQHDVRKGTAKVVGPMPISRNKIRAQRT